jgi:hypothetical protein
MFERLKAIFFRVFSTRGMRGRSKLCYVPEKVYGASPDNTGLHVISPCRPPLPTIFYNSKKCISCGLETVRSYTIEARDQKRYVGVRICNKCYPNLAQDPDRLYSTLVFRRKS